MIAAPAELPGVQICEVCRQVRRETALVAVEGGWRCADPCRKPGGRPPVGPPVLIRMPLELRAAVEALAAPGEKLAATARRLLADAVASAADELEPSPCSDCGRWHSGWIPPGCPRSEDSSGPAAAPVPSGYQPRQDGPPIEGSRGVLAEDRSGLPVLVGPVYSEKGVTAVRTLIKALPGWTVVGTSRIVSKAHLDDHGDGMWR